MVFLVYLREQRKKKSFFTFCFISFQPFFGLAMQICTAVSWSVCLSFSLCVCVWLWFSSRFLLLFFVCLFLGTVRWRFQNSKCNFPQKLNVCCSCIFIALFFRFLHFQFPFEFRLGLIKTNNDKNLIFFFWFFIYFLYCCCFSCCCCCRFGFGFGFGPDAGGICIMHSSAHSIIQRFTQPTLHSFIHSSNHSLIHSCIYI